jgi:acyl-CoA synthetase (AMP-forming)/AMP-acid ligase II
MEECSSPATETCSGDTFMPERSEIKKIGSVGAAVPNVVISIRNEAGAELAPGTDGEICMAGPGVTPCYRSGPGRAEASFFGP